MEVHPVAIVVVILLVLAYAAFTAGWFNWVSDPAPKNPSTTVPVTESTPVPSGKYANLLSILKNKSDWLFFDDASKTRQTMVIKLPADKKIQITVKGSTVNKNLDFGPHPTASDALLATDPADPSYKLILKYVDDKTIELEEQKDGKISLQLTLGA